MLATLVVLAQQSGEAPVKQPGSGFDMFVPMLFIMVLGYFLLFRLPMKRQDQQRQALLGALKKNDRVVTSGGIIGIVAAIKDKDDEVTLKVDDNVRLRVTRSSIVRILGGEESAKEQKEAGA
jgi:preprotein translocase subunit YajC